MAIDDRVRRAAAFLGQALDMTEDPTALAPDLVVVDADPTVAVFAAELDSSAGPAAFLIYAYDLTVTDDDGASGRERFDADLATLQTAAQRDVPGPRVVAHALAGGDAFILATSPATLRALTGDTTPTEVGGTPGDHPSIGDPTEARRAAATELLRLLRLADAEAATWLGGIAVTRGHDSIGEAAGQLRLTFTPEETELALVLLDDGTRHLLQALNTLLTEARARVATAKQGDY